MQVDIAATCRWEDERNIEPTGKKVERVEDAIAEGNAAP